MDERPRWSVERRLAFAEQRLFWDGALNRDDLVRRFGISPNQATADIGRLRSAEGAGIAYNTLTKRYEATPLLGASSATSEGLLSELRLLAEGRLGANESVLSSPPPLAIADAPMRAVDRDVLRAVLQAIVARRAVEAAYVSFQRPEVTRRTISPHALVFDGFRWHVRGHDAGDDRFKDFVIARLDEPRDAGPWRRSAEDDEDWSTMTRLVIAPHPGLTAHQRDVVRRDYGMDADGRLTLEVRRAVLFYVRRRLGLTEGHRDRPAHEQHVVLVSA
jgi:predicted DNA-binding transcriptional regulator YafY